MFKYLEKRNYELYNQHILAQLAKGDETFLQRMSLLQNLEIHRGCVNSVIWDDTGEYLLSGSDDQQLVISKPWNGKTVRKLRTSHRANIFSAKFIPFSSNNQIISCSGDGILIYTDLNQYDETYDCRYTCHVGTCYDVITIPSDPYSFLSCGEDGTVRWFDLRIKTSCLAHECKEDILLNMGRAVTAIAVNPLAHFQLAVSTQDSTIHIYDRRMLGTKAHDSYLSESNKAVLMRLKPQSLEGKKHRVTSLRYNSSGGQVLASYSSDYLYLFDTKDFKEIPLEGASAAEPNLENDSEPTLKRLRLRGDWSDTGPQAIPQGEMTNQAEEVGQARPTLQSTLMQRMTDILSRMLHSPSQRGSRRGVSTEGGGNAGGEEREGGEGGEAHLASVSDLPSAEEATEEAEGGRETSSAPPSIASPSEGSLPHPRLSDPSVLPPYAAVAPAQELAFTGGSPDVVEPMSEDEPQLPSHMDKNQDVAEIATPAALSCPAKLLSDDPVPEGAFEEQTVGDASLPVLPNDSPMEEEEEEVVPLPKSVRKRSSVDDSADSNNVPSTSADDSRKAAAISKDNTLANDNDHDHISSVESPPSFGQRPSQEISPSSVSQDDDEVEETTTRRRDCRMAKLVEKVMQRKRAENANRNNSITSDRWVPFGTELQQYKGHRNARTMIKEACFWGESHVMSGSDCGRVFVWEKNTGRLVMLWEADRHVVNCLQPHPTLPVLATSGIDYDVKLWAPLRAEPVFDEHKASEIAKRNEMLLAETRDTVTVPATFMIRMLATLNQLRHDRMRNRVQSPDEEEEEED